MAKRKTARQIAASRKNIRKAQIVSARKRKGRLSKAGVLKAGVAVGAVVGGTVIARKVYNRQFTYLYHNTDNRAAHLIVKQGGHSVQKGYHHDGRAFFHVKDPANKDHKYSYGMGTVKYRVRKSTLKKHLGTGKKPFRIDMEELDAFGSKALSAHPRVLARLGKAQRGKSQLNKKQLRARVSAHNPRWDLYG